MTEKENIMKSFDDLDQKELYRSAIEDFAVDVKETDTAIELRAALLEAGVKWADYVKQHPEVAPQPKAAEDVITTSNIPTPTKPVPESKPKGRVVVAEPVSGTNEDQYLIKMVRENPLFETRGYRFTQEHPYALVSPEDADYILSQEDGFRQAFPSELAEYYG